jgi:uncharacterized membrane protein
MKKLLFFWKELMATFWFVPVIIIALAIALSIGLVSLDSYIDIPQNVILQFFMVNSADSARSILATISGAMIGVAGTVFSVTLVALTLASSQFGPRLIKNFMYVRLNQVVLGAYISTYLYCVLILNTIKNSDSFKFIPSISILVAIFATIVNIILLIIFIHRIAVSIQADRVISDISDVIARQVKNIFPKKMDDDYEEGNADTSFILASYPNRISLESPSSGYLQYVPSDVLINILYEHDALLKLYHRPGSYLVKGIVLGELFTHSFWDDDKKDNILNEFVFGKTKSSHQDIEYSIHQMVEIASRALSPGVNDPYTAIACIDNLTKTMSYLAQAVFPSKNRYDEEEVLRLIVDNIDFEGVMDASFNQIRQFSEGSTAVIIRLMEAFITIQEFTKIDSHKKAVIKHAEMVLRLGKKSITEENDLNDLEKRAYKVLEK